MRPNTAKALSIAAFAAGGALAAFLAAPVPCARAGAFFFETTTGVSQLRAGEEVFGTGAPAVSDMGAGIGLGLYYGFMDGKEPVGIQVGIHHRLSMGSNPDQYSTHAPYGVVRLQVTRLFFTAGVAPLIWKRSSPTSGLDNFAIMTGSIAALVETGVLWPITREFSLGASAAGQFVKSSAGLSSPNLDFTVLMRFYFGFTKGDAADVRGGSNEWQGWRYPFGWKRND